MHKLVVILASFLAIATVAKADPVILGTVSHCDTESGQIISMVQDKYGETPMATAEGTVQHINGTWLKGNIIWFFNLKNNSYSIIFIDPASGTECLFLAGSNFMPIAQGDAL